MISYSLTPGVQADFETARNRLKQGQTVIIIGPSGCGKSHFAQKLADTLTGGQAPFVIQEAAGLSDARFESQFFGHRRGAFSGANHGFPGLAGMTAAGLLCLENIEDLQLNHQARLLRFLQTRTYRAVGDTEEKQFKGGLVMTSRLAPARLIEQGEMREDFYFRIISGELFLPAMADRRQDFQAIFHTLLQQLIRETGCQPNFDANQIAAKLAKQSFAGNYHGLRNLLVQALIRACSPLEVTTTPSRLIDSGAELPETGSLKGDLALLEKRLLIRALRQQGDLSRKALAEHLGISLRALLYKLKQHQIS